MFRKTLIDVLLERPYTVAELAEALEEKFRDVENDVRHLLRSLKHEPYKAVIEPAHCKHCGFSFWSDKLQRPGKYPKCRSTWFEPPHIHIEKQR